MVRRAQWPKLHYVAHFRTARGGSGVYYQTARAELLAAIGHLHVMVLDDVPGHMRLHFSLPRELEPSLLRAAEHLGYTEALTRGSRYHGAGRKQEARRARRLLLGAQRFGDDCFAFELIWRADERARLQRSPDRRPFEYAVGAHGEHPAGRRFRRLSPCDAMLLLNLAQVRPGWLVADPFAGIGGIVQECRRRNLRCVCGDADPALGPGLTAISAGCAAIWDACHLPLPDASVDAVVTEPPYHRRYRPALLGSLAEIARVLKPGGTAGILLPDELTEEVTAHAASAGLRLTESYPVRRAQMTAQALVFRPNGVPT